MRSSSPILLVPARVWSAGDVAARSGCAVLVEGSRITDVAPCGKFESREDAERIDLPSATLLPGLIDGPAHLFLHPYNETSWDDQVLKEPEAYRPLRAAGHGQARLGEEFTARRAPYP